MPINSEHPTYTAMKEKWSKCSDCNDGEDAVKQRGVVYLPLLTSMKSSSDPKYLAYKQRAMFYGATTRTVEGLTGMVSRKLPIIKVPPKMEPLLSDVTGTGINIYSFINNAIAEVTLKGRYSIHVDRSDTGVGLPYLVGCSAERVVNWDYNADGHLSLLVVEETESLRDKDDVYKIVVRLNYREFYLEDGIYKVRLWKPTDKKDEWKSEEIAPSKRGTPLKKIPQTFINPLGASEAIVNPPLLGMVNVNLSHYRTYADLEHGRHFTGLPTPYVTGVDMDDFAGVKAPETEGAPPKPEFIIGSENILSLPRDATAGYMEFTGAGLTYLENAAKEKSDMMALLGARLLQNQKMAAEAAETAKINKSGDSSVMVSIATAVEDAMTKALQDIADWENISGEISVEINKDMLDSTIDPQLITALLGALQNGSISQETFLFNLKKGEVIEDGITVEEEIDRIVVQKPSLGGDGIDLGDEE